MTQVRVTERGWIGHFICADQCLFRRNTLVEKCSTDVESGTTKCDGVEKDDIRIVVSTVGLLKPPGAKKFEEVGHKRYYETLIFHAKKEGNYWDADVSRGVSGLDIKWYVSKLTTNSDNEANEMHDATVEAISKRLGAGELLEASEQDTDDAA